MQFIRGIIMATILISSLATIFSVPNNVSTTTTTTTTRTADIATTNSTTCKRGTMPTKLAANCWKAMFEVPICMFDIVKAYEGGSVLDIGKPCCRAYVDLTDDCRLEVFQHAKHFKAMEGFCQAVIGAAPIGGGGVKAPPPHHHSG